jgi:hypothetical protein
VILVQDQPLEAWPQEDRGHETAIWFAYQYSCTVRDCLMMLTNPIPWVVCEWHTDFICAGAGGNPPHCLVSVKHRTPDQGPWPLSAMVDRGGLAILYKRWDNSGRHHKCRWITNAGLKTGELETRKLAELLSQPDTHLTSSIEQYARTLQPGIGATSLENVVEFLASLSLISTGGDAHSFRSQVIDEVARPILAQLGVRPGLGRAAYLAIHNLVLEAVQGLDHRECNATWYSGTEAADFGYNKRKITRERLVKCLSDHGIPVTSDKLPRSAGEESKMMRKLRAGGLGPTVLGVASRIRRRWYELEVTMRPDIPSEYGDEVDRVRAEVAAYAAKAESKHRAPGTSYGVQMHRELNDELDKASPSGRIRLTPAELLGCAYQLTDECEIWWSDQFDTATDAPWLRQNDVRESKDLIQEELPFE